MRHCHGVRLKRRAEMEHASEDMTRLAGQLRRRGIRDERVLEAITGIPRDAFVASGQTEAAYCDIALPIGCGQTISQPYVVAYMTEHLEVGPDHDVLEIGTGSGYQAAILSRLCRHVYTIERHQRLLGEAVKRFERLGLANITAVVGDGSKGWPEPCRFDRIIVTAAAAAIPEPLLDQLAIGGRMILPVGGRFGDQKLVLVEKTGEGTRQRDLLPVRFVPLVSRRSRT